MSRTVKHEGDSCPRSSTPRRAASPRWSLSTRTRWPASKTPPRNGRRQNVRIVRALGLADSRPARPAGCRAGRRRHPAEDPANRTPKEPVSSAQSADRSFRANPRRIRVIAPEPHAATGQVPGRERNGDDVTDLRHSRPHHSWSRRDQRMKRRHAAIGQVRQRAKRTSVERLDPHVRHPFHRIDEGETAAIGRPPDHAFRMRARYRERPSGQLLSIAFL